MSNLNSVFKPQSIAVVGASTKAGSVGNDVVKNLAQQGYVGKVYPVNPKAEELYGLKCYASLSAINEKVDLMVIVVPAAAVPAVLEEGGKLGIKGAVIISAGFKEMGNHDLENSLIEICTRYDIAMVGPNCLGVINPELRMNASFASILPEAGNVAFVSQSGALCSTVLDRAKSMGIGFSKFLSVGNKASSDEETIFEYLEHDEQTKVIGVYAESLSNNGQLLEKIRRISVEPNPKPIVFLKSGRTSAGANASASHTGALAGNDAAYSALFRQSLGIRAENVTELFDFIKIFSCNDLKPARRLGIITNAGGPGVISVDAAVHCGMELAKLDEKNVSLLASLLPAAANAKNPVDVLGDAKADRYAIALENVLNDVNIDSAIIILTPQSTTEVEATAKIIVEAKNKFNKPIAAVFMGEDLVKPGIEILKNGGVAAYPNPEPAVKALSAMADFYDNSKKKYEAGVGFTDIDKEAVKKIFQAARDRGELSMPESIATAVFAAYNMPVLKSDIAHSRQEAEEIASRIQTIMVLKIVSPDISHKSDAGGVMLNIMPDQVGEKFDEMMARVAKNCPTARLEGVMLREMVVDSGTEMIIGSFKEPSLGQTIMVGLGGIYVEILKDVSFGLNPIGPSDAAAMLNNLRSKKILDGARGAKPADKEKIIECLLRLSQLLTDFPEIKEMDINPLLAMEEGKGAKILDSRIVIE
jgi:acetyl coenzyme A synthetase (ADP forming)-like protein